MEIVYKTNYMKYPVLNIGETYSDYIDFINEADLTDPIMTGVDVKGRQFIVIKFRVNRKNGSYFDGIQIFFKRYSYEEKQNNNDIWMASSRGDGLMDSYCGMNAHQIIFVYELLRKKILLANKNDELFGKCCLHFRLETIESIEIRMKNN